MVEMNGGTIRVPFPRTNEPDIILLPSSFAFRRIMLAGTAVFIGAASVTHAAWSLFEEFVIAVQTVPTLTCAKPAKLRAFTSRLTSSTKSGSPPLLLVPDRCNQSGTQVIQILADVLCPAV
jgi:hypothetical protein